MSDTRKKGTACVTLGWNGVVGFIARSPTNHVGYKQKSHGATNVWLIEASFRYAPKILRYASKILHYAPKIVRCASKILRYASKIVRYASKILRCASTHP